MAARNAGSSAEPSSSSVGRLIVEPMTVPSSTRPACVIWIGRAPDRPDTRLAAATTTSAPIIAPAGMRSAVPMTAPTRPMPSITQNGKLPYLTRSAPMLRGAPVSVRLDDVGSFGAGARFRLLLHMTGRPLPRHNLMVERFLAHDARAGRR